MKRLSGLIISCLLIGGCARSSSEPGQAPAPQAGALTRTTVHESSRTVVQVLRLAPNAEIPEHHHPVFDENMILEQGSVTAVLNGTTYELHAGDIVVIPAGTVIRGRNTGNQEARLVVVFSSTGKAGSLSVA